MSLDITIKERKEFYCPDCGRLVMVQDIGEESILVGGYGTTYLSQSDTTFRMKSGLMKTIGTGRTWYLPKHRRNNLLTLFLIMNYTTPGMLNAW